MAFNWVDLVFLIVIVYFAFSNNGFLLTLIELSGFVLALLFSYNFYGYFAQPLGEIFKLPPGFASVVGFFAVWTVTELIFFAFVHFALRNLIARVKSHVVDISLGYTFGLIQGAVVFLFFISLVFGLPVRGAVKQDILNSKVGPFFVNLSRSSEASIKEVFGEAATETLNFLTVKPTSNQTVSLGFTISQDKITVDPASEQTMLELLNNERKTSGASALAVDLKLQEVAREYAQFMLVEGFFSHTSTDGTTAAIRAQNAGYKYVLLGENLAFAPDVYIAHQGLMNSTGHRRNILEPDFGRVGVGVADAGVYGKMFVQMFSD